MSREIYVYDPIVGRVVPKHEARCRMLRPARSLLTAPMLISDAMQPGQSQLDGRTYDSRSKLYASYRDYEKRTGREVDVVGNEVHHLMRDAAPPVDEAGIDRAVHEAMERCA